MVLELKMMGGGEPKSTYNRDIGHIVSSKPIKTLSIPTKFVTLKFRSLKILFAVRVCYVSVTVLMLYSLY